MRALRQLVLCALVTCSVALGTLAVPATASAAEGDLGYQGPSFGALNNPPTADKPQSKLWFHDGRWWANMWDTTTADWHIFWLNRTNNTWVDTGVRVDERASTSSDALWDGQKLYVASHVVRTGSAASAAGQAARLYRFSYSPTSKTFSLDAGFPTLINDFSSESLTIDKDSTGTIWATWTQVTGTAPDATGTVYVNSTTGTSGAWSTPLVVPTTGGVNPTTAVDDISALVAFQGRIGVLWSNQSDGTVYWSVHSDTAPRTTWTGGIARRGAGEADDHINLKSLQSDQAGRVYAVVKTGLDLLGSSTPSDAQIRLLTFRPGTASWSATTFGTLGDCHTRPQLVLDETNQRVHVIATGPTASGECTASGAGTVYMKSTPMENPSFAPGVGTPIIRDILSDNMNNVTTTKQSVTASSGLVVLASNITTDRYWHADISLGSVPAVPTSSFTSSVTSGQAPLEVAFTDTSTGSPTSWAWDFGDGATSTERNPAHTFTSAGEFTVRLVASNAAGAGTTATGTVTVTAPPAGSGSVTAASSATAVSATAASAVTVGKPAGVATGDVLIAHINVNNAADIGTAPAGWAPVVDPLSVNARATLFAYYKVVSNAANEPASYTWQLSVAETWNAGITAYRGVDTATPFDTAAATASNDVTAAASLTVPGVSTSTNGAMVIGAVGLNNAVTAVNPPTGWTESWESTGAQVAELAHRARPTAGPTGDATWTFGTAVTSAGWVRGLRPAAAVAPPRTPESSFTTSETAGTAPLTVSFTDTSTQSPTSWAWAFGDGGTSTVQNPSHTFAAGTHTVTLTASNAAGAGTPATRTITVSPAPVPVSSFTASPESGTAPLTVAFTDTSSEAPTSWAWAFGDGGTSTVQNPSHTFAAGTHTVTLTASNAAGAGSTATRTITVTAAPPTGGTGTVTAGASSTAVSTAAVTSVSIPRPAGVVAGTVLIAQFTADDGPSVTTVPAGWSAVVAPLSVDARATVFTYYKVTGAAEPASYAWGLSTAVKWNAGITAFAGVDPVTPFDTAASTASNLGANSASLTVPGVTTTRTGAMLVGGVGMNSSAATVTPPASWTETWEGTTAQVSESARQARPTAGATGNATWNFSTGVISAGWLRALRPAAGSEEPPPGPSVPVSSFTASPESGTAPLTVAFTDTSSEAPTSWAWAFGDGGTSTVQNPSHTFAAGTHTVTLTASNAAGAGSTATRTITVTAAPPTGGTGTVTAGSFTSASGATAGTAVTVPKPAGVVTGDVLVAQINADLNPNVAAAPAGWSTAIAPRSSGTGNRLFAYYKVITNASAEPASYSWTLSAAVKWNAGIADFHGVDSANPWDSAASGATGAAATSLTVPGVTTTTAGAMLVGGVGFNSTAATATPPSGWVELGEPTGGQNTEVARQARPTAGATGNAVWTFSGSYTSTGWLRALRPAAGSEEPPPGPSVPVSSFTASSESGTAPLTVAFTDTSTGSPTSWAWAFGDGGTSTVQNPSHTFAAGTHTVTLTASNAAGAGSTATRTITVTAAPPTGSAPASSFLASPESGTAPLVVSFTDTSTGSPTSWAWAFGDGGTSTVQNPSHTFAAGTHTVTLTASNASGAGTTASRTITVTPPAPGGGGGIVVGASSQALSTTTVSTVTIPTPAGVVAGDVLIAQITADDAPSITTVPAGWSTVVDPLAMGTSARLFVYYKVAGASEPASYAWGLSTPEKWNAAMTGFHGVDGANPFDTAASTRVNTSTATTLTVPGVTTATAGALLVGGVGANNASLAVTEPTGWTELVDGRGAQVTESAYQTRPAAGATGDATWQLSAAYTSAGWLRAIRPAS
ncbi:PKD domain-containing protein [Blastococcus sp. CT_GayMR19]|uniref:PKD domain-containing protein n=1 Tax=Blastococcus sp. CT_GayMR19 TaxID=2559608 RepID=UPI0010736E2D|nr:PKD domain-containing protein [Blastococcus sp. CT_GayMR19]TFV69936.1 PKD domain-containing protein [Blastococcus sp. CT_GayMR19]